MTIPKELVDSIKSGKSILFVGAMASPASPPGSTYKYEKSPPNGAELSRRLTTRCNYPDPDITNLQRVSLYFQYRLGGSRNELVNAIREEVTKFKGQSGAVVVCDIDPSPALHMLAELPFLS